MSGIELGIGDFGIEDRDAYGEEEEFIEHEESVDEQYLSYDSADFGLWYEEPLRAVRLLMRKRQMTFYFDLDEWRELRASVVATWIPEDATDLDGVQTILYNGEYCMIWFSRRDDRKSVIIWLHLKEQGQLLRFYPEDWDLFRDMMFAAGGPILPMEGGNTRI